MPRESVHQGNDISPDEIARYFKYFSQEFIRDKRPVSLRMTHAVTFYNENRKYFDRLHDICIKYDINIMKYVKFCVLVSCMKNPRDMVKKESFIHFAEYLRKQEHYRTIYNNFMKSVNNVVDACISNEMKSSVDYIRYLVRNNLLGYEYICGRISKYYIASIRNFSEFFYRLDGQNKDELGIIKNVSDELNRDLQDAFVMITNHPVSTLSYTDAKLKEKTETKKTIN